MIDFTKLPLSISSKLQNLGSNALNLAQTGLDKVMETRETIGELPGWKQTREFLKPVGGPAQTGMVKIGSEYVDPNFVGSLNKVSKTVAPKVFEGFQDMTTKTLDKLKGRSTVSKQFISDLTNSPDLKQAERDLIRKTLEEYDTNVLYHGTSKESAKKIREAGGFTPDTAKGLKDLTGFDFNSDRPISLTLDKKTAELYSGTRPEGGTGELLAFKTDDLKLATEAQYKKLGINGLKKAGYDGYHTSSPHDEMVETIVFNKEKLKLADTDIDIPQFANRVKSELLPLKRGSAGGLSGGLQYENINLPEELRGPVANYSEHIYNSPISTSAGDVHFSSAGNKNYFAHSRIEDLPGKQRGMPRDKYFSGKGDTRRVIEIQSDLFQKGRLENENFDSLGKHLTSEERGIYVKLNKDINNRIRAKQPIDDLEKQSDELERLAKERGGKELSKLEPYRNTWHERVIREEVKKAAQDGKTKLQFPTGETAMKIEGLGQTQTFSIQKPARGSNLIETVGDLSPDNMKIGMQVSGNGDRWIITDVLGDGKFKAVPKEPFKNAKLVDGVLQDNIYSNTGKKSFEPIPEHAKESFDISGKVDTNNPIYKFYEKEVGRYLKNKYNAQMITDERGVKWWQVDIKPEQGKLPVEAFALTPFLIPTKDRKEK